jgi:hypothetical protein
VSSSALRRAYVTAWRANSSRRAGKRRWALEAEAIKIRCPDCGALAGSPCESLRSSGLAAQMHKRRVRLVTYKPIP